MADDERLDALLERWEEKAPDVQEASSSDALRAEISRYEGSESLADDLAKVQQAIRRTSRRFAAKANSLEDPND